jgi:hypothetical protein
MYIPPTRSIPLFEKKNEGQIDAGISTNSLYATAAYSITNKFALAVNGNLSFRNFSSFYDIFSTIYSNRQLMYDFTNRGGDNAFAHRYIEGSFGRYNVLANYKASSFLMMEVFAGGGYGKATDKYEYEYEYNNSKDNFNSNYYLAFVQFNVGVKKNHIEGGVSIRSSFSGYHFLYESTIYDNKNVRIYNLHFEPLIFGRFGGERLKFNVRLGFNLVTVLNPVSISDINVGRGIIDGYFRHTITHISVGISYKFAFKNDK